ncbi:PadR family transcriptional regulator [Acidipropionibacterium jensenii]|nr:PadR family transcriptional regulator [Acidipropionibacterium jensenii]AZZ43249.1 PadR family transcriptional regulator [Acidipropionibacterium jensenii]MDN6624457.1 PadR family transcriptional regulator [Acidipropionibacterium jensenii]QCV89224.1 helix-turn-helix transcriptional regulator [Acidipropionibacterium jensenii]
MQVSKELVAASATPIVLGVLSHGQDYGYSLLRRIAEASGGQLEWKEGMLYPLLHRLEQQGLISSRWGVSPEGRRRKYYDITETGRSELETHVCQWRLVISTLGVLLPTAAGDSPIPAAGI